MKATRSRHAAHLTEPGEAWRQITRALLIHRPDPGHPTHAGRLAALGLLAALANVEAGEPLATNDGGTP